MLAKSLQSFKLATRFDPDHLERGVLTPSEEDLAFGQAESSHDFSAMHAGNQVRLCTFGAFGTGFEGNG